MDNLDEIIESCDFDPLKIGVKVLESFGYFIEIWRGYTGDSDDTMVIVFGDEKQELCRFYY